MQKIVQGIFLLSLLSGCGGGSSSNDGNPTQSNENNAPISNAGIDQNITTGSTAKLDGSGSTDSDGDTLTYRWSLTNIPEGSNATLTSNIDISPTFTADIDGSYIAQLVANDGVVDSSVDTVTIVSATPNLIPVAHAGADQAIPISTVVTLDGSGSSDPDGGALSYSWSLINIPTGSNVSITNPTNSSPTFTVDITGDYIAQLIVNDGIDDSAIDTITISASILSVGLVVDSQIIGLRYKSVSPTGYIKEDITNAKGEYEYFEGGTTGFYVGEIKVGDIESKKFVAITSTVSTEKESENIAVFLQTIDEDSNPENGIQISSTVDQHAQRITDFKFDDTFNENIDYVKTELFKHAANIPATVSVENAINHSSKSERLSSLHEFDLYKAIANEKNYRGGDYYNADVLENDQRKRVYLWIWQKLIAKEMDIEDELQFTKPEFDIDNVEQTRNQVKKYLDYAESVVSIASLGKGAHESLVKAGSRTMSYSFAKLTSLTVGGCGAVVKLYDADTDDTVELSDSDLCTNMMKVINPVGDSASKLAIANPIMSGFLPELLPKLIHAQKMNWLHFNTKSLRTISKMKVGKPDVISIALSIAQISNDFYGASWASDINEELTTRMVAREWLNIHFRSGFNQEYKNKLINNNSVTLTGTSNQVEAIALKLGSTGALCDTYEFFNPFYECTGIENINYNHEKVLSIISDKLSKSNALYTNIIGLTGSISNEKSEIGVIEIDWIEDAEVDTYVPDDNFNNSLSIIFEDEFDVNDELANRWDVIQRRGCCGAGEPASYIKNAGKLMLAVNGVSSGYMGIGDGSLFIPKDIKLNGDFYVESSMTEVSRKRNNDYKDNSGIGISVEGYESTVAIASIGINGNHSGYYEGHSYDEYEGHRIDTSISHPYKELSLNVLYKVFFRIYRVDDVITIGYKLEGEENWTDSQGISNSDDLKVIVSIGSGDGGRTFQNGDFSASIDYLRIEN